MQLNLIPFAPGPNWVVQQDSKSFAGSRLLKLAVDLNVTLHWRIEDWFDDNNSAVYMDSSIDPSELIWEGAKARLATCP